MSPTWTLSSRVAQFLQRDGLPRLLVGEVQEHGIADEPFERETARVEALAIVVVGELHVRAAMGRHFHVLQDVPHVRVAPVLRIQLVGKMGLQAEMVLFLVGQQLVTEVHDSAVQHGNGGLEFGSK